MKELGGGGSSLSAGHNNQISQSGGSRGGDCGPAQPILGKKGSKSQNVSQQGKQPPPPFPRPLAQSLFTTESYVESYVDHARFPVNHLRNN